MPTRSPRLLDPTAGIKILTPMADSPFGPMFSFEGPEGYTLTAHGG
ncbi:hypothetical protein [Streptomyces sp. NPDC050264]